jgi:hypothetical protein
MFVAYIRDSSSPEIERNWSIIRDKDEKMRKRIFQLMSGGDTFNSTNCWPREFEGRKDSNPLRHGFPFGGGNLVWRSGLSREL